MTYLRVSVTDRCDFRCVYCMAEDMTFLPKAEILSLEELDRLCSAFVRKGVKKLRLTGGEPLVRRNIMSLIKPLGRHLKTGDLEELTLTSNGSQLARFADELVDAGVRRINVSLDTLDADRFEAITRWGKLDKVLDGIDAAPQGRPAREDQHGGAQELQRRRTGPHDRILRRKRLRHDLDRNHAAGRDRPGTARTSTCRFRPCARTWNGTGR